jgi:predicted DNA-binding protein
MSTANEFTKLLLETNKAVQATHIILDYVDLVNSQKGDLAPEAGASAERLRELADDVGKQIEILRYYINEALNRIVIEPEDCKAAANNLILYHHTLEDAIAHAERQMQGYQEGSYWWRFWSGVLENLLEKKKEA